MTDSSRNPRVPGVRGGGGNRGDTGRSALDRLDTVSAHRHPQDAGEGAEPAAADWGVAAMPAWLAPRSLSDAGDFSVGDLDDPDWGAGAADDDEDGGDTDLDSRRRRTMIAPPAAIAIIAVGVVACAVAAFGLFRGDDAAPVVDFPSPAGAAASVSAPAPLATSSAAPAMLVVSVVGLVHEPGLVNLKASARVADALAAAGGPRPGADTVSLNLAQVLHDGDQVLVGYSGPDRQQSMRSAVIAASGAAPHPGGGETPAGASRPSGTGVGGLVNLNTASAEQLDALPGVGPVTAQAIVQWRSRRGAFSSVEQLGEVDGIGPARLAKLRTLVTV